MAPATPSLRATPACSPSSAWPAGCCSRAAPGACASCTGPPSTRSTPRTPGGCAASSRGRRRCRAATCAPSTSSGRSEMNGASEACPCQNLLRWPALMSLLRIARWTSLSLGSDPHSGSGSCSRCHRRSASGGGRLHRCSSRCRSSRCRSISRHRHSSSSSSSTELGCRVGPSRVVRRRVGPSRVGNSSSSHRGPRRSCRVAALRPFRLERHRSGRRPNPPRRRAR
mmetsp:Transcript_119842/g.383740  ORF Transcript_119842/g.383740 Transcript_119842/m.383740 type:complete len:226 (-) Transcript_119842:407-1084(-)